MVRTYHGWRDESGAHVEVREAGGEPGPLRQVVYHSPTGMEWGYGGSGPADLALSILADHFGEVGPARSTTNPAVIEKACPRAFAAHQSFKWAFIAILAPGSAVWQLTSQEIDDWFARRKAWAEEA